MNDQKYVYFNDGDTEDNHALFLGSGDPGKDRLFVLEGKDAGSIVSAARREKADYGPEGGGRTWHT